MLQYSICAFLAPALVSAAAFPWALPEPTFVIPAQDNWSPAPTQGPELGAIELFKKRADDDNTCGYISGHSIESLTCNNSNYVCATNTYYGVHGCCDPKSLASCTIPTTCIPSSMMSASCTDSACSSNSFIAKCTDSDAPYCYEWRYVYSTRTVMTEHGCAASAFITSVQRTYTDGTTSAPSAVPSDPGLSSDASSSEAASPTVSDSSSAGTSTTGPANAQSATASPTDSASAEPATKKKSNIGPIIGGVVGGLAILGALAFAVIFLILRNKKAKQNAANAATGVSTPMMGGPAPGVTEYKPQPGSYTPGQQYPPTPGQQYAAPGQYAPPTAAGYYGHENKAWQQQGAPGTEVGGQNIYSPPGSPAPQYTGPTATQPVPFGAVEAGGTAIPGHPSQQQTQSRPVYEAP